MILGSYPCCDGALAIALPEQMETPKYMKENCPHCGVVVWHRLERLDPMSWNEEGFLLEHEVDEEKKQIKERRS